MKGIAILILFFHHNYLGPDRWLNSPISFYPFSQSQIMYIAKFLKIVEDFKSSTPKKENVPTPQAQKTKIPEQAFEPAVEDDDMPF